MRRPAAAAVLGAMLAACNPGEPASQPRQDAPYDFLVLSLSWSPSYCETEGKDANRQQCGAQRPHAFVVHGLWPQFESGWPEFCPSDEPARVPDPLVRDLLDIMPSAGLIGHQWRKHGTCSGMSQRDYFSLVREAYEQVTIPRRFEQTRGRNSIAPDGRCGEGVSRCQCEPCGRRHGRHLQRGLHHGGPHLPRKGPLVPYMPGN